MIFKESAVRRAFTLLESGPVILVSVYDGKKNNAMTVSWHAVTDFDGGIALISGSWNESFDTMMKTKECVICVPPASMLETVVKIGTVSGKNVDKFKFFGLTAEKGRFVSAPLITECLSCIECKVENYIENPGIVLLRAVEVWENTEIKDRRTAHAVGDGTFIIDGEIKNYKKLMAEKLPEGI